MKTLKLALCFAAFMLSTQAFAALSPVGVSILPPIQFPPEDFSVTGVSASVLWGYHRNVYGIEVGGLGNITELESRGIQIAGLVNVNKGQTTGAGLQAAGIGNYDVNKANIYGVQFAGIFNFDEAESSVNGLQLALFNLADHTTIRGFQVGVYNEALVVYGLQIGVVNVTDSLHGVQIGLINFNHKGLFSVSPILNASF